MKIVDVKAVFQTGEVRVYSDLDGCFFAEAWLADGQYRGGVQTSMGNLDGLEDRMKVALQLWHCIHPGHELQRLVLDGVNYGVSWTDDHNADLVDLLELVNRVHIPK